MNLRFRYNCLTRSWKTAPFPVVLEFIEARATGGEENDVAGRRRLPGSLDRLLQGCREGGPDRPADEAVDLLPRLAEEDQLPDPLAEEGDERSKSPSLSRPPRRRMTGEEKLWSARATAPTLVPLESS